ncbi:hypothetical protein [Saccharomonospora piscinae]|uniref:hypothetical protein n=1 Tax=Saccharomonospora piscinae TaxID=687388 RepID=UPI00207BA146|nr:hypothetical protein [Saccharomonospora piscinae]
MKAQVEEAVAARAKREGVSPGELKGRLLAEGYAQRDHPGIVFRGPWHDRRAALAEGPDVWEVASRLRELDGPEEHRIAVLCEETALHPRHVRIAIDYAAEHLDEVLERIERNEEAAKRSRRAVQRRAALFAAVPDPGGRPRA